MTLAGNVKGSHENQAGSAVRPLCARWGWRWSSQGATWGGRGCTGRGALPLDEGPEGQGQLDPVSLIVGCSGHLGHPLPLGRLSLILLLGWGPGPQGKVL